MSSPWCVHTRDTATAKAAKVSSMFTPQGLLIAAWPVGGEAVAALPDAVCCTCQCRHAMCMSCYRLTTMVRATMYVCLRALHSIFHQLCGTGILQTPALTSSVILLADPRHDGMWSWPAQLSACPSRLGTMLRRMHRLRNRLSAGCCFDIPG